ncbi:Uncharacterized protein HZ326_29886 [Fusarium oxysporum f. sp. albedinis]|nr:Uncharacterized protein HZ326_29886 [Fusarium oxysporum f. sp. albedinis]
MQDQVTYFFGGCTLDEITNVQLACKSSGISRIQPSTSISTHYFGLVRDSHDSLILMVHISIRSPGREDSGNTYQYLTWYPFARQDGFKRLFNELIRFSMTSSYSLATKKTKAAKHQP